MEPLNLLEHDPEDFPGKSLTINETEYELGILVGSGLSKFVYQLRNRRSGLTLHVLCIYRDPETAAAELTNERAAKGVAEVLGGVEVPNLMKLDLDGAVAALQDYYGPFEEPPSQQLLASERLLVDERWDEATDLLDTLLAARPEHTVALNNRAYALSRLGRPEEAFESIATAVDIEPNFLPYLQTWLRLAAGTGQYEQAIEACLAIQDRFPYDRTGEPLVPEIAEAARLLHNEGVRLAQTEQVDDAVDTADHATRIYGLLAELDPETYDVEFAEGLFNAGSFRLLAADPLGAVEPVLTMMTIAHDYGRQDLFDAGAELIRHALADDPRGVAEEFVRLTGEEPPDWLLTTQP